MGASSADGPENTRAGADRWPTVADMAVPAIAAVVQLGLTWLVQHSGDDDPMSQGQWQAITATVLLSCVALLWRRRFPVVVLAVTVVLSGAGVLIGQKADTGLSGISDGIALYSLAVHRDRRHAVIGCLAAFAAAFAVFAPMRENLPDLVWNEVMELAWYVAVAALGQLRRQKKARRRELAERLAEADRERTAAAESERERLARDLHDVAGHHLSAVVVHSGAASRIDDPGLTGEALRTAAETGRDVLEALGRLVDVVGPDTDGGGLDSLLPPLCHGLTRLGVPVSLDVAGRARGLPPEVVTAVYRIVQESLTNAMRYASGAPVAVLIEYVPGAVEVEVVNGAPDDGGAAPALGTGRGIAGMRERATALGGTLDAGPEACGWAVRASVPTSAAGRGAGWPEVLDAVTIAFCCALPALLAFSPPDNLMSGRPFGVLVVVALGLLLRALPLWWRRRTPYAALTGLVVFDTLWVLSGLGDQILLEVFAVSVPAQAIAVYSVAAYARPGRRSWPAALIMAGPWVTLSLVIVRLEYESDPMPPGELGLALAYGVVISALLATLVLLPFWAWGRTVARRGRHWELTALETMAARTGEAVLAERHRIAMGLRGTVLDHTARLVRAAEAGLAGTAADGRAALDVVTGQARAALVDMRELLDAMEDHTVDGRVDGRVDGGAKEEQR
ncbi:histidine kinase [Spirillospora sp. NPDC047279]|uniref:sensor histidine kinase n=1 Tax=Spirillospora sp. NPDC047279 TaxID=3155478 RepID=UPI0033E8DA09